jgi:hypothetical protein
MIAALAAGNKIIPCGLPTARARKYMIQGKFRRRILTTTILAGGVVT